MDFAGLSHRAFLQKSTPRGSQGKKSEHSFRSSQTAKTNESTTLILHGIPGVGESKKSRGDLANFRSAIRDFSSVCGTLFRDMGFFFVLRNRTGGFFRSKGKISVLRNTVPRSEIFLRFAEQDRRFLVKSFFRCKLPFFGITRHHVPADLGRRTSGAPRPPD